MKIKKNSKEIDEMRLKVSQAYSLLPDQCKREAASIHGVGVPYFIRITKGEPQNIDVYYSALSAMKQAAKQTFRNLEILKSIEVNDPKTL